uniref:Ribosomal protein S18 n=1 Tax=Neogoniolithon spectabile TaxID=231755 RepID=A0A3G3MGW5_9FLOR|nr:ribosomal protein S18 [Neogoniolithon spectabile]AYR06070.1 ribosomal protein S18 [Neogoniolithon spectabile]
MLTQSRNHDIHISYRDIDTLNNYINEQGKILPRRISNIKIKQQKKITKNIKRARILAMMPFIYK